MLWITITRKIEVPKSFTLKSLPIQNRYLSFMILFAWVYIVANKNNTTFTSVQLYDREKAF
jgi:hypothetical protein